MVDDNELNRLRDSAVPKPSADAKARALNAAFEAFDEKKINRHPRIAAKPSSH